MNDSRMGFNQRADAKIVRKTPDGTLEQTGDAESSKWGMRCLNCGFIFWAPLGMAMTKPAKRNIKKLYKRCPGEDCSALWAPVPVEKKRKK